MVEPRSRPRDARMVVRIAKHIREQILQGDLLPGARLLEANLARTLHVSRAPVREAARLLEREGLLDFQANRGFSVRQPTPQSFREISGVRAAIERYAIRQAATMPARPRLISQLEAIFDDIIMYCERKEWEKQTTTDFLFHRAIVASSENSRLILAFDHIAVELRLGLRAMGLAAEEWEAFAGSHRAIVDALRTGDPTICEREIETHIALGLEEAVILLAAEVTKAAPDPHGP